MSRLMSKMYGVVKGTQQGHVPEKWREYPPRPQEVSGSL